MALRLWWGVTLVGEGFFVRVAPACCALLVAVKPPLHSQATPEWLELAAEFSIGREEPGYDLTMVGDVVTGSGGMILVAQPREGLVRVFDSTGSFIGSVGRRGSGPGEFQRVSGLTVRGDTLMVSDGSLSRVSVFLPRWTLIQTISVSPALAGRSYRRLAPLGVLRDGSVVASPVVAATIANNPEAIVLPLYVVGRDNEIKGILAELDMSDVSARISTGARFIAISRPLSNASLWDVAADGSVVAVVHPRVPTGSRRERFQVIALRSPADTVFCVWFSYTPRELPASTRDSIVASWIEELSRSAPRPLLNREVPNALNLPRYQPPVSDVLVAGDGRVWLRRERFGRAVGLWAVLDSGGRIVAYAVGPSGTELKHVEGSRAWGVELDENDIPRVVRYRVRPSRPGADAPDLQPSGRCG